jgi:hypothetical protein
VGLDLSCPKGWGFFSPDLELSEYFCPRCDVAFLVLNDRRSPGVVIQELRWKTVAARGKARGRRRLPGFHGAA